MSLRSYDRWVACLSPDDQQALSMYSLYVRRNYPRATQRAKLENLPRVLQQLPLPVPLRLAAVTPAHIVEFIQRAQQQGLAATSINSYLSAVYGCFGYLQEEGYLRQNPVQPRRHYLPCPVRLPRPMAREDVRRLFALSLSAQERAIFLVALHCGLRVSEVAQLKRTDLDWERHTLRVEQGKARVDRMVYLTEEVEKSLREWLSLRTVYSEYVFCSRQSQKHPDRCVSPKHLNRLLKRALQRAGIAPSKYSFHTLRHTFATELLNAGISLRSLQELLGHKSLHEVLIYAQLYESTRRQDFYRAMATIEAHPQPQLLAVGGA